MDVDQARIKKVYLYLNVAENKLQPLADIESSV
jgi:hypothetical protein